MRIEVAGGSREVDAKFEEEEVLRKSTERDILRSECMGEGDEN